ncbi:PLP-dependent aminotransferase family protein [Ensifer adhaerens]|uniref:aminotransferase-like domain-containing protein n=1 Tax=Ensifer canadensis TaxID=555315 RepID=UPI00148FF1C8|nr:PLP-dependent aminotransferase family protein [Ensifer canadensis]NOV20277.1 PLP-dependent aminotransferase family protein [Ensifer canadensis]
MQDWIPDLSNSGKPRYLAIADCVACDIRAGTLNVGDRLPPQRKLAEKMGIDFTTVARGYAEAQRRGLIESRKGQGTFVGGASRTSTSASQTSVFRVEDIDLSMNLPPEPDEPELMARMRAGWEAIAPDMVSFLRYRSFGGGGGDKEAALSWLSRRALTPTAEQVYITPGAHSALHGILSALAKPGQTILCEALTFPGVRSIAAQLGLYLQGLPVDAEGIVPAAFSDFCVKLSPPALYLNPTLQNPTGLTMSQRRREEIIAIARRWEVAIIEDDAYGFIPVESPPPIASMAPDLTWYVASLSKSMGAGLRVAFVIAPESRSSWAFASAVRSAAVMASPITVALASRWIEDGTADSILGFVRDESRERQKIAAGILEPYSFNSDPAGFNIWLPLPEGWTRSAFAAHMRSTGIGVVVSDAFIAAGTPPEAVRICLGGPASRSTVRRALEYAAHALESVPASTSSFL